MPDYGVAPPVRGLVASCTPGRAPSRSIDRKTFMASRVLTG